jgi:exo-1,4-beta-D-glucosaminidase
MIAAHAIEEASGAQLRSAARPDGRHEQSEVHELKQPYAAKRGDRRSGPRGGTTRDVREGRIDVREGAAVGPDQLGAVHLEDKRGAALSQNFYWLSTVEDVLDWSKRDWYYTPPTVHGDFTALATLPRVTLGVKTAFDRDGADGRAHVTLTNPGTALAFFVRLRVLQKPGGGEILPSMWSDNYVSLLPGETRTLTARWRSEDAPGATPAVAVDGWNVLSK